MCVFGACMASRLAEGNHSFRCVKCGKWASIRYVGEYGVRFACSCARAGSGCWTLPKNDVL